MKSLETMALAARLFVFEESGTGMAGYVLMLAIIAGGAAIAAGYAPQLEQEYQQIADFVARVFVAVGGPP